MKPLPRGLRVDGRRTVRGSSGPVQYARSRTHRGEHMFTLNAAIRGGLVVQQPHPPIQIKMGRRQVAACETENRAVPGLAVLARTVPWRDGRTAVRLDQEPLIIPANCVSPTILVVGLARVSISGPELERQHAEINIDGSGENLAEPRRNTLHFGHRRSVGACLRTRSSAEEGSTCGPNRRRRGVYAGRWRARSTSDAPP